jgi:hypothetical protein
VRNEATGEVRSVVTNDSGHYTVTNLPPGLYTITIEATGFKKNDSTHNKLDANTALSADAVLTIGAMTETVEVSATAAVLQTASAAVQEEVTGQQVNMQELNGRNPLYMAQLLPGMRSGSTMGDFNFAVVRIGAFWVGLQHSIEDIGSARYIDAGERGRKSFVFGGGVALNQGL